MEALHLIHPGNRGIHWCDMESSRFFVRDDGLSGERFEDHVAKFRQFPRVSGRARLRLTHGFEVHHRAGAALAVIPSSPSWLVGTTGLEVALTRLAGGSSAEELAAGIVFAPSALDELLANLWVKGLLSVDGRTRVPVAAPVLNRSDEMGLIELTRRCNLRCKHCFNDSAEALAQELGFDEVCALIDRIVDGRGDRFEDKTMVLSGGEPMLRRDLFDIVDHVNALGFRAEVLTNGTVMTARLLEGLARRSVKVRVSLDGCTAETHEWMRGQGTFEPTVASIRALRDRGIDVGITTSVSAHNFHQLEQILSFVDDLGVSFFQFIIVSRLGRAVPNRVEGLDDAAVYATFSRIAAERPSFREAMRDSTLGNTIACNTAGLFFHHCGLGLQKNYYVQADGDIFPCRATILPRFRLGNVRTMGDTSFENFEHPLLKDLQKLKVDSLNPVCAACEFRYWCAGECRGETFQSTGSLVGPTEHCGELIRGFEEVLWLTAADPSIYFEKSNAFYRRTGRTDLITDALQTGWRA